jgi:2-dehydro-3-deoxygluconokinase
MFDVVAFGEAMIRLSPPHFMRLEQTHTLDVVVGGGELNVAVSCSRLGLRTAWVSRLTDNPLGRMVRNKAREQGVNTDYCLWTKGDRIGLYFMEFGAAPRASSVLYDRASSAIANIRPGEVDWGKVLNGARLFHVSGITPALSRSAAEVTTEALKAAKAAGCQVSYDLNYRSKLWSAEEARRIQTPMMEYVDILISTEEDTKVVFGISAQGTDDKSFTDVKAEGYKTVAKALQERFKFRAVAITLRRTITVWRNGWSAIAYDGKRFYEDVEREVEIVDRIGGGDSFSAGLIYGYLKGDLDYGLKFGNAFSALKHSIPGDLNWVNVDEVEGLMKGSGSLRVQR